MTNWMALELLVKVLALIFFKLKKPIKKLAVCSLKKLIDRFMEI